MFHPSLPKVAPQYPDIAREAGVEGTVMVQALVCSSGLIYDTRIDRSIPMLDSAATEAIRQWVFKPALANHVPVAVWVVIPVRFSLHRPEAVVGEPQSLGRSSLRASEVSAPR
jgi:periplasmic protein TonB